MREFRKVSRNVVDILDETKRNNQDDLDPNIDKAKIISLFVLSEKCDFLGRISKTTGVWKYLSDYNYIMLLHEPEWLNLTENQKHALVFHELLHIRTREDKDENIVWQLRKHDIEEFLPVVKKFGFWSPQLKLLESLKDDKQDEHME